MARAYDSWERLVEAVLRKEQFRQLSLENSRTPSTRSFDSDFSFSLCSQSFRIPPSPLNPNLLKIKLMKKRKKSGTAKKRWKGLFIFSGFPFSSKKDYGKEERELQWSEARKTLHGLEPMRTSFDLGKQSYDEVAIIHEDAKRRDEITRLRELHIEAILKTKNLHINSIKKYHTG